MLVINNVCVHVSLILVQSKGASWALTSNGSQIGRGHVYFNVPNRMLGSCAMQGAPENRVSLVQLADESAVLLIHISAMNWMGMSGNTILSF